MSSIRTTSNKRPCPSLATSFVFLPLTILWFALSLPAAGETSEPPGPTTDEIVAASIDATGGAALDAVKAVKREGTLHLDSPVFGVLDGTWKVAFIPGRKGYQIADFGVAATATGWNGNAGWESGAMGVRDLAPDEVALNRIGWEINVLHALVRDGMKGGLVRIADAAIDDRPHYVLEYTSETDAKLQIYVDANNFLISRLTSTIAIPQMGTAAVTLDFADYADYGEIQLPQSSSQTIEGLWVIEMAYTSTDLEPALDASLFEKPGN